MRDKELTLPDLVTKASSIDLHGDLIPEKSGKNENSHGDGNQLLRQQKKVHPNPSYQEFIQGVLKKKMKESWLNTSYQRAIWNARRRLMRGQASNELDTEMNDILSGLMLPKMKPDYSKWKLQKSRIAHNVSLPTLKPTGEKHTLNGKAFRLEQGVRPSYELQSANDLDASGLEIYPVEFISLADRLTLHEPPWLRNLRDGREVETYDNFGLCFGCFHQRGPHYHYRVPVRIGGGFTIYRRNPMQWNLSGAHNSVWINDQRQSVKSLIGTEYGAIWLSDDFTLELFHTFLDNGGDSNALKEYLESNFDEKVLEDLEQDGVNVQQILDYTEVLRRYIREKLERNINDQERIVQDMDDDLQYIKCFVKIRAAGVDLEMLLSLLEEGHGSKTIQNFEIRGGNVELLEHFGAGLLSLFVGVNINEHGDDSDELEVPDQTMKKARLVNKLRTYIEKENEHKRASLLLDFMEKGGRLDLLVRYVEKGATGMSDGLTAEDESLVREYAETYADKSMLLEDIEKFAKEHFRVYSTANLLRKYIESGGKISYLKQYVESGCSFTSQKVRTFLADGGDLKILQEVGEDFFNDSSMRNDLDRFPTDPNVLDAYIRKGGKSSQLVAAIAELSGNASVKKYIAKWIDFSASKDLINDESAPKKQSLGEGQSTQRTNRLVSSSYPPPNSPQRNKDRHARSIRSRSSDEILHLAQSSENLSSQLVSYIIETAQAEMKYDKLVATEEIRKKNEGQFMAKTVEFNQIRLIEAIRNRRPPYIDRYQVDPASVSSITGKKRQRLWKAPKPFMLRRSDFKPTRASAPFSENRSYDLPSLSEDHILNAERNQRHALDVLRRNYKSRDFRNNWKVEIRSPDGSVISEHDSTTSHEFTNTGPVILKQPEPFQSTAKVSRRDKQRMKMRASKRSKSKNESKSRSPSLLSLPSTDTTSPIATMISRESSSVAKAGKVIADKSAPITDDRSLKDISIPPIHHGAVAEDARSVNQVIFADETRKEDGEVDETNMVSSSDEDIKRKEYGVPPLPVFRGEIDDDTLLTQTAFGKPTTPQTPPKRIPIFPEMVTEPPTQVSAFEEKREKMPRSDLSYRVERKSMRLRRVMRSMDRSIDKESESEEETSGSSVEDVLKKYCIIRDERLPRYRHIFDKHIMLMEMRSQEKEMKSMRANNFEDDYYYDVYSGPASEELKKCEFLWETLTQKIEEVEMEVKAAKGFLDRSKVLTAREYLYKNPKLLRAARKSIRKSISRQKRLEEDSFQQTISLETAETEMGSAQSTSLYDYDQSARFGYGNAPDQDSAVDVSPRRSPLLTKNKFNKQTEVPLQAMDDSEIQKMLNSRMKKKIQADPIVQQNKSALLSLQDKLKRLFSRRDKLRVRLETQRALAQAERERYDAERSGKQHFVRQQSEMFQTLHPEEDPVLDIDDVPEALRDVNGELTRADSDIILEALDFPRPGNGVNFRVFCILAALSESAKSIEPLVRRLRRTKDARALTVKMDKCKEIYDSLLGPSVDNLYSELRSNGFTTAQQYQMMKKLTRDNGDLSFLDFVTYVPLFLDIHQQIIANPLTAR